MDARPPVSAIINGVMRGCRGLHHALVHQIVMYRASLFLPTKECELFLPEELDLLPYLVSVSLLVVRRELFDRYLVGQFRANGLAC